MGRETRRQRTCARDRWRTAETHKEGDDDRRLPKEIKNEEYRVAMTPNGVKDFVRAGHTVIVEAGAGVGSGFSDDEYKAAGAELASVDDVFARADMIYKVKEPIPSEYAKFKPGQILYTYLHMAAAYARAAHRRHDRRRDPRHRLRDASRGRTAPIRCSSR